MPEATRRLARGLLSLAAGFASRPPTSAELEARALIVAPHPDDETLGCGGTIAIKRTRGAAVDVAFVCDGTSSHEGGTPSARREQREREARAATADLGVAAEGLHFLATPDGGIPARRGSLLARCAALLEQLEPEQLFVPYARDLHPDHVATRSLFLEAAEARGRPVQLLEYPVWFFDQWPWMRPWEGRARRGGPAWRRTLRGAAAFVRELRVRVELPPEVLARKRLALSRHRSQMEGPEGSADAPTLGAVAEGDFLARLLDRRERFCVRELRSPRP